MEHNLTVHVELWRKWFEYGKKIPEKDVKMGPPQERLPERKDETLASGARLQISLKERGGTHEVQIEGHRKGLQALAAICSGLAELTQEQLLTPANHYHVDENFWGTEKGSVPLIVWCRADGWPESDAGGGK